MKSYLQLALLMLLFASCGGEQEKTQPTVEDISESVYASGVVKSKNQYQVFPMVNGVIQQVLVTEGDVVQAGEPLLRVENEAARLNTENARLAADYARVSANEDKLNELQAAIDLAESKKHNDSLLLVRQQNLWAGQIGTRVELEQRELSYKNAVTAYRSALLRYNDLKKQLDFAERQAQKNLQISQTRTNDYTVKSETDGKVYSVLKEKGEMVSPQSPVAVIGDADEFILELQVDEYDISRIRPGQKVLLNLDSYKGQVFEAVITKINPAMNERTRSFTVDASFVTTPPALYPNLTTEANIIIQAKANALLIPREYLLDGSFVLKENDEKVKVSTGLKDYQKVEILDGLTREDVIVKPVR
ncbi:HlyD family efflux transporter periplasmic adaptor subunit [Pontibacter diazotrophicus]|uniref:HlyD family efflux transporter periplasmic adaptor subunit n=1 Tax=Pontibacter diazotrophicus TaxID=1400979 RepID=A0A3D8LB12_9BACT|nr:HlyD family efflux transporter periplasmic adaptor subunit [Pontibacter diazotrophicus]RDV14588.1 HlyD family efflux transporter periplasmic adaptor subunit [Pontibacter diazotrophicus]